MVTKEKTEMLWSTDHSAVFELERVSSGLVILRFKEVGFRGHIVGIQMNASTA